MAITSPKASCEVVLDLGLYPLLHLHLELVILYLMIYREPTLF